MRIPMVDLDRVQGDIATARGVPNAYYTDLNAYAHERDTIFADQWACVAFASDVPEAGAVFPVQLAGMPLLVVCDRQDTIRVFHNVC